MVRVGGGWDTLEHYLDKHDPCRCKAGHRLATSAKLTMLQGKSSIPSMHVTYNRPPQAPSSNPSSPQNHRRSLSYMSPTTARKSFHQSSSPPTSGRPLPPTICSDDSSNSSLQDTLEGRSSNKPPSRRVSRDGGVTSSDDEGSDEESYKRASRRRPERRELVFKDTVPSSWKYSPGIPRKEYQQQQQPVTVAFGTGHQRKLSDGYGSRLPALTPRNENKQPPKVVKVSPRPHYPSNWSEPRSQSSEDLFQLPASGPAQPRGLVFHSRGPSPVNIKGRNNISERLPAEIGFRRNDPKRHSSPRISTRPDAKMRISPPKFLPAKSPQTPLQNARNIPQNSSPNRRMFWSPERQAPSKSLLHRKNSAPTSEKIASPVLEKLLQNSDLCTDKNFLMKIEQLITEFEAKTKLDDSNDDFSSVQYNSLPTHLGDQTDSKLNNFHARKSPLENNNNSKSPSKIPVPTWYSKCHS
uniref:GAS2-like protein 1 n=1 Tax=Parasteatoda tepidariorum TaxID=114398 RepID=A0A2L2Y6K4_PARTP